MQDYEKLGAFYLGKRFDLERGAVQDDLILYDARDLVTHALCVGMTGSGKTGLCLALLEEAAIDGVPAIAIDPKGDLGNLLLTFPALRPEDFRPWIEDADAARAGRTGDEQAASTAEAWRAGLSDWGQSGERIQRFKDSADVAIYTPGSSAGLSLSLLKSFAPPPAAVAADADSLRERIAATVSGLLGLLALEVDPLQSREHILFALLFERAWVEGRALSLADLVRDVQDPPIEQVGVLDLESFFPSKERTALALRLNNLLASPGHQAWTQGEALDVQRLLYTPEGRPRIAILSIAHLSDAERMFFVTLLLNEVVAWMRGQSGTTSLRAILYMDEIFGFFPPSANPPSKIPLLTLLKQSRAFGLGCVLATQNPVDLDYKGLANCGTWFIRRLQTERDKLRVLDGLEGASAAQNAPFERGEMERVLSGLQKRVFLLHNVHDDHPVLFQTRFALSYLRGPLTKSQIQTLMASRKAHDAAASAATSPAAAVRAAPARAQAAVVSNDASAGTAGGVRPFVPPEVVELFAPSASTPTTYRPCLLGSARVHYVDGKWGVDTWHSLDLLAALDGADGNPWERAEDLADGAAFAREPAPGASFARLPPEAQRAKTFVAWSKSLADALYRTRTLALSACPSLELVSRVNEPRSEFLLRVSQAAREARDAELARLRPKYAPKLATLTEKVRRAEERVRREESQYDQQKTQSFLSVGASVLGALFGRKLASSGNVGRATTAARGISRATREKGDVAAAGQALARAKEEYAALEAQFARDRATLTAPADPAALGIVELHVKPRKSDTAVERVALVWMA